MNEGNAHRLLITDEDKHELVCHGRGPRSIARLWTPKQGVELTLEDAEALTAWLTMKIKREKEIQLMNEADEAARAALNALGMPLSTKQAREVLGNILNDEAKSEQD